jgi:predicted RNA-binding Zn ribbon-like protein
MPTLRALCLLLLIVAAPASARSAADSAATLRRADVERATAMVAADRPALERLLDPALSYAHASGAVQGRTELLDALAAGTLRYSAIRTRDVSARAYGPTGIVVATADLEVVANGAPRTMAVGYTATYRKRSGRWQLLAYRSTALAPPP